MVENAGNGWLGYYWADWVKRATNGRMEVQWLEPGTIVKTTELFDAVGAGAIEAAGSYYPGFEVAKIPEADIEDALPMAWPRLEDWYDGMILRGIGEKLRPVYASYNLYNIPMTWNDIYFLATTFPISRLSDIKGKKIRAVALYGKLVQALGATPVSMPAEENYMALKLGTVDGNISSISALRDWNAQEVWKYYVTEPRVSCIGGNFIINMDSWNALPDDIRDILARDSVGVIMEASVKSAAVVKQWVAYAEQNYGFQTVSLPEEDRELLTQLSQSLYDEVAAKTPLCKELVEIVRQQMRDSGRL